MPWAIVGQAGSQPARANMHMLVIDFDPRLPAEELLQPTHRRCLQHEPAGEQQQVQELELYSEH